MEAAMSEDQECSPKVRAALDELLPRLAEMTPEERESLKWEWNRRYCIECGWPMDPGGICYCLADC